MERATTELSSEVASSTTMRLGDRFLLPDSFFLRGVFHKGIGRTGRWSFFYEACCKRKGKTRGKREVAYIQTLHLRAYFPRLPPRQREGVTLPRLEEAPLLQRQDEGITLPRL